MLIPMVLQNENSKYGIKKEFIAFFCGFTTLLSHFHAYTYRERRTTAGYGTRRFARNEGKNSHSFQERNK
jgi:hypothetical protein